MQAVSNPEITGQIGEQPRYLELSILRSRDSIFATATVRDLIETELRQR
jgi:hypothetical protein